MRTSFIAPVDAETKMYFQFILGDRNSKVLVRRTSKLITPLQNVEVFVHAKAT
jgi:hypothetical protein